MTTIDVERERDYHIRRKRAWDAKNRRMIPAPRVGHWTDAEDQVILRDGITTREKAAMLQRSYASVANRLSDLRRAERATCKACGSGFWMIPAKTDAAAQKGFYSRGLFCSRECAYASRRREGYERNKRQCMQCGAEFRARARGAKYCSQRCMGDHKVIHQPMPCEECGKAFKPQLVKNTRHGKCLTRFCSMTCAGANKRRRTAERRTRECANCGRVFAPADGRTRNCSRECGSKARIDALPELTCESCGSKFRRPARNGKWPRCCSMKCRSATKAAR